MRTWKTAAGGSVALLLASAATAAGQQQAAAVPAAPSAVQPAAEPAAPVPPAPPAAEPAAAPDLRLSPYAHPGGPVDIGGRRIDLRCTGTGGPVVVLAEGLGGFSMSWYKVQPEIARRTRTCAFDRAGFGYSDPPATPQSMADVAADLHAALRAAHIPPPYVLVGQSLGGIEVRLFAERWPDEIGGMVLVDSSFAEQGMVFRSLPGADPTVRETQTAKRQRCEARAAAGALTMDNSGDPDACVRAPFAGAPDDLRAVWLTFFRPSSFAGLKSLADPDSMARLASADRIDLGDRPLIVLTAGRQSSGSTGTPEYYAAVRKTWLERHAAFSRLSRRGEHRIVEGAGHSIHFEKPEAVVAAITDVLDQLRSTDAGSAGRD